MQPPGSWRTRANALTSVRLVAAPALVVAIGADCAWAATAVFALAVASDFADGMVARRFAEHSGLGRLVDHAADAVFVTAGAATLAHARVLPALLPTLIAASFIQYALDSKIARAAGPRPSALGRLNGIAYYAIVAIPIVRDALGLGWPGPALVMALGWVLVVTTLVSMADRLVESRVRARSRNPEP